MWGLMAAVAQIAPQLLCTRLSGVACYPHYLILGLIKNLFSHVFYTFRAI